ncbi:MAG: histidinol dehydrogenase, partial [Planctomycetota bacterium]|nr:histidinol dehydrogenase [Planctomycetota bacterium]
FSSAAAEAGAAAAIRSVCGDAGGTAALENSGIDPGLMLEARNQASESFLTAVSLARVNLRRFHEYQRRQGYLHDNGDGAGLSRVVRPLSRIGICCGSSPAALLMCAVPAQVAGVGRIAVAAAADAAGKVDPALLAVARLLDLDEVYRLDGALAAAALALGAGPIRRVDKVVGRLDAAGAAVGRMLSGQAGFAVSVGFGGLAVVADAGANARFIASDLLARAGMEGDPGPLALFATDRWLAEAVRIEILRRLDAAAAGQAKRNLERAGGLFLCTGAEEAIGAVNLLAPSRLELMTRDNQACLADVENAGAVFLGPWSPDGAGDVFSCLGLGLPAAGAARFASGIGVGDFVKEISVVECAPERLLRARRHFQALLEGDPLGEVALRERLEMLKAGW